MREPRYEIKRKKQGKNGEKDRRFLKQIKKGGHEVFFAKAFCPQCGRTHKDIKITNHSGSFACCGTKFIVSYNPDSEPLDQLVYEK